MARLWLFLAALLGAAAVAAGSMTSHDFDEQLAKRGLDETTVEKRVEQSDIAVRYHLAHAIAMFGAGLLAWSSRSVLAHFASLGFLVGIACFSGALYAIVFFDQERATAIVPVGGVCLIVAWVLLALASLFAGHRYVVVEVTSGRPTMDDRA